MEVFSCPHGPAENIFEGFLAVRTEVNKNFLEVFLAVRMEVNENIFEGFTTTNAKIEEKRSMSQMIDLVMTIKTSTGSSKSELSSRGKRPLKVLCKIFFCNNLLRRAIRPLGYGPTVSRLPL